MATLLTAGKRTISALVREVFDYDADDYLAGTPDYMLAYRFYNEHDEYFTLADQNQGTAVEPTPKLLDLITEGISQNQGATSDREFSRSLLEGTKSLTDGHKEYLSNALKSYVNRVDNYRVYLEPRDGYAKPAGRDYLRTRYKTRFNDSGRARMQVAKFKRALELAPLYLYDERDVCDRLGRLRRADLDAFDLGDDADRLAPTVGDRGLTAYSSWLDRLDGDNVDDVLAGLGEPDKGAVMCTITTDPSNFDNLLEMIETMNDDHNRLQSWLATQPSTVNDGRQRWSGRLPYLKAFEFTDDGKPHLHLLFFGVPRNQNGTPWLVDKNALVEYCRDNLGRCRIVDLEPLEYKTDLGERYGADAGFVSPHDVDTSARDGIDDGQTAGQYLGKYLSATYGGILDLSEDGSEYLEEVDAYDDKMSAYRLALYWATDTSILTFSKDLENLALHDDGEDWDLSAYEYVGTYHIDDTPDSLLSNSVDLDYFELDEMGGTPDFSRADRPPPDYDSPLTTKDRLLGKTRS
jgi:hypothetical protein